MFKKHFGALLCGKNTNSHEAAAVDVVHRRMVRTMAEPNHVGTLRLNRRRPVPSVEWQHSLPSRAEAISPYIDQLMRFLKGFMNKVGAAEESAIDIEIALREALANAVIHGNHEDPHKCIYASCRCQIDGEVSITIRDEGDGFDSRAVADPTHPQRRLPSNGRGIYLLQVLTDEVSFEEPGNIVHMRKKLRTAQ
jgi:serine/threonine-protein kinase RsbW